MITGNACAGKTTLARILANELELPLTHLDSIVWKENFKARAPEENRRIIGDLIKKSPWIIEGVSSQACERSECIIFIDIPRHNTRSNRVVA